MSFVAAIIRICMASNVQAGFEDTCRCPMRSSTKRCSPGLLATASERILSANRKRASQQQPPSEQP
eukprot:11183782-Alexandrium_andersonii.AAC.1